MIGEAWRLPYELMEFTLLYLTLGKVWCLPLGLGACGGSAE